MLDIYLAPLDISHHRILCMSALVPRVYFNNPSTVIVEARSLKEFAHNDIAQ